MLRAELRLPAGITTKSALVARDIDLLSAMACRGLARVYLSIGTLDTDLAKRMEPRANSPARRLDAIRRLAEAGVPVALTIKRVLEDHQGNPVRAMTEWRRRLRRSGKFEGGKLMLFLGARTTG